MITIENERLVVQLSSKGAELQSVFHKQTRLEYMWQANPAYWSKHSPVLFPIVGTLKDNSYYYKDQVYQLNRHGFARESDFVVTESKEDSVVFSLHSNLETLKKYPFDFIFSIRYTLDNDALQVTYEVNNTDKKTMYFSVGGHPAFKLPLAEGFTYTDYSLVFNKNETTGRWLISSEGLIKETSVPLLADQNILPLDKSLFYSDAIVLKELKSTSVRIEAPKSPHGLDFDFSGFPYLGIWAAKDADFVCIEPWCGIADSVTANQLLTEKEGIEKVAAGEVFSRTWSARFY